MQRIYFLDVTVFTLHVNHRIIRDVEVDTDLAVTIDLKDLPRLIVRRNEIHDNLSLTNLDYNAGAACHFVEKRSSLLDTLKRNPLRIGIYRVGDRFPVCHCVLPFSGCVCEMVKLLIVNIHWLHLNREPCVRIAQSIDEPSPFEFGGTFNLIDPGGNPAGQIILRLVLTDLGSRVTSSFVLDVTGFVMKNYLEGAEYKFVRSKNSEHCDEENSLSSGNNCSSTELIPESFMRDIAGISLGACGLSLGKTQAKRAYESLEVPGKISVESKLNDKKKIDDKIKKKSNKKGG